MYKKKINEFLSFIKKGGERTVKLKVNVFGSFSIKGVAILLEMIKVPLLIDYLDSERYGVWLTIVSILMWAQNFDLGLGAGLRYKLTESFAYKKYQKSKQLVSTAYICMFLAMTFFSLIIIPVLYSLNWNNILNVSSISNIELQRIVVYMFIIFVFQFILKLVCVVLRADQRSAIADILTPIGTVISLCVVYIIRLFTSNSILLAAIAMALPYTLVLLFSNFYFYTKRYHKIRPSFLSFNKDYISEIFSLGLKYFISQLSALIVFSSSNIILSKVVSPSEVSVFNTARTYFNLFIILYTIILIPFSAAITDAYVLNDFDWIKRSMKKLNIVAFYFSILIVFSLFISPYVFSIWVGDRILIPFNLCVVLSVYSILNVFVSPYSNFLNGVGKLTINVYSGMFKIVLFIPVALEFVKLWGSIGLVISIILVNTLLNLVLGVFQYFLIINKKDYGIWSR